MASLSANLWWPMHLTSSKWPWAWWVDSTRTIDPTIVQSSSYSDNLDNWAMPGHSGRINLNLLPECKSVTMATKMVKLPWWIVLGQGQSKKWDNSLNEIDLLLSKCKNDRIEKFTCFGEVEIYELKCRMNCVQQYMHYLKDHYVHYYCWWCLLYLFVYI